MTIRKAANRLLALLLTVTFFAVLTGCESKPLTPPLGTNVKVGIVLVGDESDSGYNYNHIVGLRKACDELIIPDSNIVIMRNVPENEDSEAAMRQLADEGCDIIFATSFGYEPYMLKVAQDYPGIQFCHCSGSASAESSLENVHNYFPKIFEARYLSGIAAGMKANEIKNYKLGYVGAFDLPEVISGFTAFYLGAKSVAPEVTMRVIYIMDWNNPELEAEIARKLIADGAGILGQHSDSNAIALVAEAEGIFQVGYNADMVTDAPKASLISARLRWSSYYRYALNAVKSGVPFSKDWSEGFSGNAVYLSQLNEAIAANGTADAIAEAEKRLNSGYHVFSGPLYGISANGDILDIKDGEFFDECSTRSSPSFDFILSGITVENAGGVNDEF
ncbi:MAG: BMP family ABC transporter substrate-binding protein [Oscillospiraceae bacterium]|jgi:basic membrane protein A|nr:BMP family ABC transporter substrate-binding protein [Oscillospiraceae bacterium]